MWKRPSVFEDFFVQVLNSVATKIMSAAIIVPASFVLFTQAVHQENFAAKANVL